MDADDRFAQVAWDPKFRSAPKRRRKVKIDKRFEAMFNDARFQLSYAVDKRGRPAGHTSSEDLQRFYDLPEWEPEQGNAPAEQTALQPENGASEVSRRKHRAHKEHDFNAGDVDIDEQESDLEIEVDLARGQGNIDSSSDTESSEWELEEDDQQSHAWGELDNEAPRAVAVTSRLAVCNMDWDRIRARDLFVLFNSFKPADGVIRSVTIYPSEFGLRRMRDEDVSGPQELRSDGAILDDADDQGVDAYDYDAEKLREYQLKRLKYYFAIVDCDSPSTASAIYDACDGTEYESCALAMDLRFVPDGMTFDAEAKDVVYDSGDLSTYQPAQFSNSAAQQTRVSVTWDETDVRRTQFVDRAFKSTNFDLLDVKDFLASSSGSDDEQDTVNLLDERMPSRTSKVVKYEEASSTQDAIEKYRTLMRDVEQQQLEHRRTVELEISWEPGLTQSTHSTHEEKQSVSNKSQTPWQQYLERRKLKRSERRAERSMKKNAQAALPPPVETMPSGGPIAEEELEVKQLELLVADDSLSGKLYHHRSKKPVSQPQDAGDAVVRPKDTDAFAVDIADPRFEAMYSSHMYNLDPSDPLFKQTDSMRLFVRRQIEHSAQKSNFTSHLKNDSSVGAQRALDDANATRTNTSASVNVDSLVKSVKAKTSALQKKKQKTS